ncbi:MAG: YceD family protein [Candidatus Melainabacteria bacterium]|nr:YceD family protein [Candidatus Melainabacteria bacterium]
MQINVDELNEMPLRRIRLDFNEMLDVDDVVKPVVGELFLQASGAGVVVTGTVQTLLKLNCHSCLRPFFSSLSVDIDEQLASGTNQTAHPRDRELNKDDFFEFVPDSGILDISDIVYQAVTLASPVFCRCGADCPGPPKPEKALAAEGSAVSMSDSEDDSPIDPRWENLKTLFSKQESGENS